MFSKMYCKTAVTGAFTEAGTYLEQKNYYFLRKSNVFFANMLRAAVSSTSRQAPLETVLSFKDSQNKARQVRLRPALLTDQEQSTCSQLHWHSATLALSHNGTQPHWHFATLAFSHTRTQPHSHSATLAFSNTDTQPHWHSATLALSHAGSTTLKV